MKNRIAITTKTLDTESLESQIRSLGSYQAPKAHYENIEQKTKDRQLMVFGKTWYVYAVQYNQIQIRIVSKV